MKTEITRTKEGTYLWKGIEFSSDEIKALYYELKVDYEKKDLRDFILCDEDLSDEELDKIARTVIDNILNSDDYSENWTKLEKKVLSKLRK